MNGLIVKKSYQVKWRKSDLAAHAPRRLNQALIEAGETSLDAVIRTGLIHFIEMTEEGQCSGEYPKFSSEGLGPEPSRVRRVQRFLSKAGKT
jgi:hypothetical protein